MVTTRRRSSQQSWQHEARQERKRRQADTTREPAPDYRFRPADYIRDKLGWEPWAGQGPDQPGQMEVLAAYTLALRQFHERHAWENGELDEDDLVYWQPGQTIQNRIRIEAGHTVGKTKLLSGIFSHYFDCFADSIIYTFAPTYEQINDLLWKEIRTDRRKNRRPGRVMESPELKDYENPAHFGKGKATNNSGGTGTERTHGQHAPYQMFILDEAEGIPGYVFDAVESMASGGIAPIVVMAANPRTDISRFHKEKNRPDTVNFRISCHFFPNVVHGREIVPGGVRRDYVTGMTALHCERAAQHDPEAYTFEHPWQPGVIYLPNNEYLFRVMGIAPKHSSVNTFVSRGLYEAALRRPPLNDPPHIARLGMDAARWGNDSGTMYVRHGGRVWRAAQMQKQDGYAYYVAARNFILDVLIPAGVRDVEVRIDGTGGYGSTAIDLLRRDIDLRAKLERLEVIEVSFGGRAYDSSKYADIVTEIYAHTAEALRGLQVFDPPERLEADLTDRRYGYVHKTGRAVLKLEDKDRFRARQEPPRSPDDGDGLALAVAPDFLFAPRPDEQTNAGEAHVIHRDDIFS